MLHSTVVFQKSTDAYREALADSIRICNSFQAQNSGPQRASDPRWNMPRVLTLWASVLKSTVDKLLRHAGIVGACSEHGQWRLAFHLASNISSLPVPAARLALSSTERKRRDSICAGDDRPCQGWTGVECRLGQSLASPTPEAPDTPRTTPPTRASPNVVD